MKRTQRPVTELKYGERFLVNSMSFMGRLGADLPGLPEAIAQWRSRQLDML